MDYQTHKVNEQKRDGQRNRAKRRLTLRKPKSKPAKTKTNTERSCKVLLEVPVPSTIGLDDIASDSIPICYTALVL